jgi:hypothetical protein
MGSDDGVYHSELIGFWTCPSSSIKKILKIREQRFGNWICFRPQVRGEGLVPSQLGPLERANLNHWTT